MKKGKKIVKNNIKVCIAFIIGLVISGGSAAVVYAVAGSAVGYTDTYGIGATTVQGAIDKLYQKASTCPDSAFKLGDYFTLVPDVATYKVKASTTGYTSDQDINIAGTSDSDGLRLWRVINIHSDGSVDAVSEYVSYNNVFFRGTTGYANFVGGLQTIAAQYAKAGYTIDTRMMGYGGQTTTIADTTMFDGTTTPTYTTSTAIPGSGTGQEYKLTSPGDLGDTLYLRDYQLVKNVYKSDTSTYGTNGLKAYKVGTTTATAYWLSSRRFSYDSSYFNFNGRYISTGGTLENYNIRYYNTSYNSWNDFSRSEALRPIITLKSGVSISGGSGTKERPYTLS